MFNAPVCHRFRCSASGGSPAPRGRGPGEAGFTFAEVLAAMLFLAILIPVVVQGLALANKAAVVAERNSIALQLAQNRLNSLVLDDAWLTAEVSGDFQPDYPGYRYEFKQGTWSRDNLVELELSVRFEVQGQEYEVRLNTLVAEPSL